MSRVTALLGGVQVSRVVRCIPSADTAFSDAAIAAFRSINKNLRPDDVSWALANLLRPMYPAVTVYRQEELARVDGVDVWYAYRDEIAL